MTFKAIAQRIGKDQTTVSKEVKKHLNFTASKVLHCDRNGNENPPPVCPKLLKTPFVCNPCEKKRYSCPFQKQKYIAKLAQQEYEALLVDAREGIALNKEEFYTADQVITDGIQQGSISITYCRAITYECRNLLCTAICKKDTFPYPQ